MRTEFVRRQAEDEAYNAQQVRAFCYKNPLVLVIFFTINGTSMSGFDHRSCSRRQRSSAKPCWHKRRKSLHSRGRSRKHSVKLQSSCGGRKKGVLCQKVVLMLLRPLQAGSHEARAEGEGAAAAGRHQETLP